MSTNPWVRVTDDVKPRREYSIRESQLTEVHEVLDKPAAYADGTAIAPKYTPAALVPNQADPEPKGNASTEEWTAYARSQGATDEDLVDEDGTDLGRDAIREKYGAPEPIASTPDANKSGNQPQNPEE